ncbi:MAG: hypothetical protein ACKV2O_13235 [Acidimicrobiales bacterium]
MAPRPPTAPAPAVASSPGGQRHLSPVLPPRRRPAAPNAASAAPAPPAAPDLLDQMRLQDRELRQWHLQIRAWALAEGLALDRDGLTAVLAIVLEAQRLGGPDPAWWTVERVGDLAWSGCAGWAARRGVPLPAGTAAALVGFWAYLAAGPGLAPGSAALAVLVEALHTHTNPAQRGSRGKHPSIGKQNVRA